MTTQNKPIFFIPRTTPIYFKILDPEENLDGVATINYWNGEEVVAGENLKEIPFLPLGKVNPGIKVCTRHSPYVHLFVRNEPKRKYCLFTSSEKIKVNVEHQKNKSFLISFLGRKVMEESLSLRLNSIPRQILDNIYGKFIPNQDFYFLNKELELTKGMEIPSIYLRTPSVSLRPEKRTSSLKRKKELLEERENNLFLSALKKLTSIPVKGNLTVDSLRSLFMYFERKFSIKPHHILMDLKTHLDLQRKYGSDQIGVYQINFLYGTKIIRSKKNLNRTLYVFPEPNMFGKFLEEESPVLFTHFDLEAKSHIEEEINMAFGKNLNFLTFKLDQ